MGAARSRPLLAHAAAPAGKTKGLTSSASHAPPGGSLPTQKGKEQQQRQQQQQQATKVEGSKDDIFGTEAAAGRKCAGGPLGCAVAAVRAEAPGAAPRPPARLLARLLSSTASLARSTSPHRPPHTASAQAHRGGVRDLQRGGAGLWAQGRRRHRPLPLRLRLLLLSGGGSRAARLQPGRAPAGCARRPPLAGPAGRAGLPPAGLERMLPDC